MGGKTQQRVAGNVKPSSSGRIRELLMNKHGVGNIITFSTLSKNEQQPASPKIQPKSTDSSAPEVVPETIGNSPPTPQVTPKAKPTLIVRKVGGRDLYTRVIVPRESLNRPTDIASDDSSPENLAHSLRQEKCGPEVENSNYDTEKFDHEVESTDQTIDQVQISQDEETTPTEVEREIFDFDEVLDQLNQIQNSLGRDASYCLDNLEQNKMTQELELLRLLDILIVNFKDELSIEEWDLMNSSIHKWVGMISRTTTKISKCPIRTKFSIDVFNFIHKLILLAKSLKNIENLKEDFPMLQSLLDDWENFQSSSVCQDLIIQYFKLVCESNPNQEHLEVLTALANIIIDIDPRLVVFSPNLAKYLETKRELDLEFKQPKNSKFCCIDERMAIGFSAMTNLLRSNYREIIVSSHSMLSKIMSDLCASSDISSIITEQDDIDNLSIFPPVALMSILTSNDAIMSALLSDYRVGDTSVTVEPNTDSYSCVLGYLFAWDLTIQFIVGVDKEIGHRIIHSLKRLGLIQRLLDNVFMLVPPLGERDSLNLKIESDKNFVNIDDRPWSLGDFLKSPLRTTIRRPSNEIELAALHVYFSVALHMPVTVRKWYNNNSNKKLCNLVNEYTVKHISQVICSLEMDTVQEKCQERANEDKLNNLVIKARPSAKEVYAIYTRDEFKMELTIKLPINYPLGSVQIDGGKRVGVTDVKWRSWLLQLTTFLSHQNGPILDGIDLWRRNIDKRFEGIEKCMICFSILHSNYQLPKKKCLTCSKMFHNLCLYKWFETSGNSTCPLCRNAW